jgi:hypothetical protein
MSAYIFKSQTYRTVPEIIDPVFAKTSPKRSISLIKNELFGLVFTKTGYICKFGHRTVHSRSFGILDNCKSTVHACTRIYCKLYAIVIPCFLCALLILGLVSINIKNKKPYWTKDIHKLFLEKYVSI